MSLAIRMAFVLRKGWSQSQGLPWQDVTSRTVSLGCNRDVELAKGLHGLVKQSLLCLFWAALRRQWPWGGERLGQGCEGQETFLVLALFPYSSLGICCDWCQMWTWTSVTIPVLLRFLLILQQQWNLRCLGSSSFSQVQVPVIVWVTTQPYFVGWVLKSLQKGQNHHLFCKD